MRATCGGRVQRRTARGLCLPHTAGANHRTCIVTSMGHVLTANRFTTAAWLAAAPVDTALLYSDAATLRLLRYIPLVSAFLWSPGAFLPRPEDRRQPPFLDQLYASNGGCSTSMCHRVGAGAVQRGRGGEAGWPAAPPGRLVARAAAATLLASHARTVVSRSRLAALRLILGRTAPHTELDRCAGPRTHRAARRHCGTPVRPRPGRLTHRALPATCATLPPNFSPPRARVRPREFLSPPMNDSRLLILR